jgi:hypothetical protein
MTVTLAAYCRPPESRSPPPCPQRVADLLAGHPLGLDCYFVKYQSSGLMLSVVLCGVTPWRLLATSVSW